MTMLSVSRRIQLFALVTLLPGLQLASCGPDSNPADPYAGCRVSAASTNFGTVAVGLSKHASFTITNDGSDLLAGTFTLRGTRHFEASDQFFYLEADESQSLSAFFRPKSAGSHSWTTICSAELTGIGVISPCPASPAEIDFGTVAVGDSVDAAFTFTNTSNDSITGSVSVRFNLYLTGVPCPDIAIVSGGGPYALAAAQTDTVVVRFRPLQYRSYQCLVDLGNYVCSGVELSGVGDTLTTTPLD